MRTVRTLGALVMVLAIASVAPAGATHNIPRDLSIKYSAAKHKFKGKLRRGRYYAESAAFQAPGGFCPKVRSRVLEL